MPYTQIKTAHFYTQIYTQKEARYTEPPFVSYYVLCAFDIAYLVIVAVAEYNYK